jgi:hypothetical protein
VNLESLTPSGGGASPVQGTVGPERLAPIGEGVAPAIPSVPAASVSAAKRRKKGRKRRSGGKKGKG